MILTLFLPPNRNFIISAAENRNVRNSAAKITFNAHPKSRLRGKYQKNLSPGTHGIPGPMGPDIYIYIYIYIAISRGSHGIPGEALGPNI